MLVGPTGAGKAGLSCGLLLKTLENTYRSQFVRLKAHPCARRIEGRIDPEEPSKFLD